jgi:hypothetical protein
VTSPTLVQPAGGLADTLNILLDKGLVIDATVRVSALGIEVLTIEARIVIASVDTFIRYLEAMKRLNATPAPGQLSQGLAHTAGLIPQQARTVAMVATDQPVTSTVEQQIKPGGEQPTKSSGTTKS